MRFEYRIHWEASSHYGFRGATDWTAWVGDDATPDEIEADLSKGSGALAQGLEEALEGSGFGWSVEVREAGQS